MSGEEVRARWQQRVEKDLPPPHMVEARSRVIAAQYARWYQLHPDIYKWAGVAAFACHRIGMALAPYDFLVFDGVVTRVADDYDHPHGAEVLFNDLNHLRQANNAFFDDVAWALAAYVDPEGGMAAVEAGIPGDAGHQGLLEAFRKIDRARPLLASPATRVEGEALIWEATSLIEYHGQAYSAQKFYDSIGRNFDLFMSVFTAMNFEVYIFAFSRWKFTDFYTYMWTRGLPKLIATFSPPDIRRVDHRWYWIQNRVMPIWRKVDAEDPTLERNIAGIVRAGGLSVRTLTDADAASAPRPVATPQTSEADAAAARDSKAASRAIG